MNITWTLAYRNPRANRFQRVTNWSGTWHQAYELARVFNDAHPDLQVYYTQTAQSEQDQAVRLACEVAGGQVSQELANSYLEDHRNILVDSGRRVMIRETGKLSDEILAQVPDADEAKARYQDNGRPARHLA